MSTGSPSSTRVWKAYRACISISWTACQAAVLTLLKQSCDPIPTLTRQPSASLLRLCTWVWKSSSHCEDCNVHRVRSACD